MLSISGKEWKFPAEIVIDEKLLAAAGGEKLLAQLLIRRGITTSSQAAKFLDPGRYEPTSPMELPDMALAVARITRAIAENEHITVYGDYDVDGVTGTAVLVSTLKDLGADVDYYIPNRSSEGYGLNLKAVSILASKRRTKLIVTCDCGVANFAEINFAKSLGVDTIVADHHTMPEMLPPAAAIIHPKRLAEEHPLYHLPGVGVAFKLSEALFTENGQPEAALKLLDYVTLGMIADLVPLVKENRYLVQIGLPALVKPERPGLRALLAQVGPAGGTDLVGFGLAPRINAVGRLADAQSAVELMITADHMQAEALAHRLQLDNGRRQQLCDQILEEAEQMLKEKIDLSTAKAIAIYKEGWHHGVVGIVASRLVEKYHRPTFIGELDSQEGFVRGSARGVEGIDLWQALKANEHLLHRWGGHKMAAGFTIEADKAETFCQAVAETCKAMLADKNMIPSLEIDAVINPNQVSMELVNILATLAPFGMANKKPVLVMKGLTCVDARRIGKGGKHNRIILEENGFVFESVYWNSKDKSPQISQKMDVAFNVEINTFNGRDRLQLVIIDWLDPQGKFHGVTSNLPERQTTAVAERKPSVPAHNAQVTEPCQPLSAAINEETASSKCVWKDLRNQASPRELLDAARRKLGKQLAVFNETYQRIAAVDFVDRTTVSSSSHLMLWQFPPSVTVLQNLLARSKAAHVYLVDRQMEKPEDATDFLRRLLGLARFAVNQREGKAAAEKIEAALGTTTMAVALGLTVLRRLNVLDWFAEDGFVYLDLLAEATGNAESLPEFRQLANCLQEINQFRLWAAEVDIEELKLTVESHQIDFQTPGGISRRMDELDEFQNKTAIATQEPRHSTSIVDS